MPSDSEISSQKADLDKDLFGTDSDEDDQQPIPVVKKSKNAIETDSSDSASINETKVAPTKTVYRSEDLFGSSDEDEGNIEPENPDSDEQQDLESLQQELERPINASIPNLNVSKQSQDMYLIKLPSLLNIESVPFDSNDKSQELSVLNTTMRWRHSKNKSQPESNARLVRWSDDSFSLLVGDEFFDVGITDIASRNQFLTIQHPNAELMKVETRFTNIMSFRPHSTDSLAHKKMIMQLNLGTKQNKTMQKVVMRDPEQAAREALKMEQEREKQRRKLESKRRQSGRTLGEDGFH